MDTRSPQPQTQAQDRFYFHSSPRTASNVLLRILNLTSQPNLKPTFTEGYFFMPYFMALRSSNLQGKDPATWSVSQTTEIQSTLHSCFTNFVTFLEDTDVKGQRCFVKEHSDFVFDPSALSACLSQSQSLSDLSVDFRSVLRDELPAHLLLSPNRTPIPEGTVQSDHPIYSSKNQTLLPDAFLRTWKPTFLIRHPALVFPSQYRAFSDMQKIRDDHNNWEVTMTFRWARKLYELYVEILPQEAAENGTEMKNTWPIVLEADEVLSPNNNNFALLRKYCQIMGFEEEKLVFEWEEAGEGHVYMGNKVARRMCDTLNGSTGLVGGKLVGVVDIEVEKGKWRVEFGEEGAGRMEGWVRGAMPDYEFLRERRLRV